MIKLGGELSKLSHIITLAKQAADGGQPQYNYQDPNSPPIPRSYLEQLAEQTNASNEEQKAWNGAPSWHSSNYGRNLVSPYNLIKGLGRDVAGPMGEIGGELFGGQVAKTLGLGNLQTGYGGNAAEFARDEPLMQEARHQGHDELGAKIRSMIGNVPLSDSMIGKLTNIAANNFLPGGKRSLETLFPSVATDYSPLLQASAYANNGSINKDYYENLRKNFDQANKSGQFGNVPTNIAMQSIPYAAANASNGQFDLHGAANLTRAADKFVQSGLAKTFGQGMQLAGNDVNRVMTDPTAMEHNADEIKQLAQRGMADYSQFPAMAELAHRNGQAPLQGLQSYALGLQANNALRGMPNNQRFQAGATNVLSRTPQSDTARLLSAYRSMGSNNIKEVDQATHGHPEMLEGILNKARANPQIMAARNTSDPSYISDMDTGAQAGLAQYSLNNMGNAYGQQFRDLASGKAIAGKNLEQRVREGDWGGVNNVVRNKFSNPNIAGTALALGQYKNPTPIKPWAPIDYSKSQPTPNIPKG